MITDKDNKIYYVTFSFSPFSSLRFLVTLITVCETNLAGSIRLAALFVGSSATWTLSLYEELLMFS